MQSRVSVKSPKSGHRKVQHASCRLPSTNTDRAATRCGNLSRAKSRDEEGYSD
ncbi:hypothetical protein [uncultured Porphyromonas sp.]|uniref:hypothetical protein n=1 Tax=uncultured Porphyromonas sp. TaxID=159274 RepID=UPI0026260AE6|nr:hypothetical protein [uncultured Porphyromonas sp.]